MNRNDGQETRLFWVEVEGLFGRWVQRAKGGISQVMTYLNESKVASLT